MIKSLGIIFPGQGSQAVGMLADIAKEYSEVKAVFDRASAVLGYDLWKFVQTAPCEELDKTVHTQPALLAASYALWQIIYTRKKLQPIILAGHSLGEYTALVCAKAIEFEDAIKLVAARGEFMQEAMPVGEGALAAIIGLDDSSVKQICLRAVIDNEVLAPANYNSPGQVVIAGHTTAVERALIIAKEDGARMVKLLPISVSSHCDLMKPAAHKLAIQLASIQIKKPCIPVVSNADVSIYQSPETIREGLIRQLYSPVRWVETIEHFAKQGVTHAIECGPGKVLTGLNKRIVSSMDLASTADLDSLTTLLNTDYDNQRAS